MKILFEFTKEGTRVTMPESLSRQGVLAIMASWFAAETSQLAQEEDQKAKVPLVVAPGGLRVPRAN